MKMFTKRNAMIMAGGAAVALFALGKIQGETDKTSTLYKVGQFFGLKPA